MIIDQTSGAVQQSPVMLGRGVWAWSAVEGAAVVVAGDVEGKIRPWPTIGGEIRAAARVAGTAQSSPSIGGEIRVNP